MTFSNSRARNAIKKSTKIILQDRHRVNLCPTRTYEAGLAVDRRALARVRGRRLSPRILDVEEKKLSIQLVARTRTASRFGPRQGQGNKTTNPKRVGGLGIPIPPTNGIDVGRAASFLARSEPVARRQKRLTTDNDAKK
jgi:hypothetical protein